jgi:hypothetical protein
MYNILLWVYLVGVLVMMFALRKESNDLWLKLLFIACSWLSVAVLSGVHYLLISNSLQKRVGRWLVKCFGTGTWVTTKKERSYRFFEEATELVQANNMTREECHQLVDYTFDRPVGELKQEVGGVRITLSALCETEGVDENAAAEAEYKRINKPDIIERIRQKQLTKPQFSPLPGVAE